MTERLTPGFLGISEGDDTLNAICIGVDGEPYWFEVDKAQADAIEGYFAGDYANDLSLADVAPELTFGDRQLLVYGKLVGEWAEEVEIEILVDDEVDEDDDQLDMFDPIPWDRRH